VVVAKKRVLVNGVGKRLQDFIGHFNTVVFRPAELELVTESPSVRRNFLDTVLSQVDYEYRRALLSYEKGMRRRNKILLAIRDEGKSRSELYFWDKLLIKNGEYIASKRSDFIDFVNRFEFVGSSEYSILYDRSVISEERLKQYERQEVFAGKTLVGPHRDDIKFKITNAKLKIERELDAFGSRGEQRMGVLWVKVAEIDFIERRLGRRPTLLLDDIFSELDHGHRVLVGDLAHKQQTILTTSDSHFAQELGAADIIELEG
jgi:DNA replication and repair protein RecF